MINNFEKIKSLLQFNNEDEFYYCQIIKRKKENEGLGSNNFVAKTYYISSIEDLEKNKGEMICLAEYHNARVCINLNRRSFEKIAFNNLIKTTNQIANKDFKSVRKAYNSVCGLYSIETERKWIIDIDVKNNTQLILDIEKHINIIEPINNNKVFSILETQNGFHIITSPFNMKEFNTKFSFVDVHKDNPTIMYCNLK